MLQAFWSERGFCGDYFNFDRESCINACFNVTVDGKAALFGQIFGNKVYEQTESTRINVGHKKCDIFNTNYLYSIGISTSYSSNWHTCLVVLLKHPLITARKLGTGQTTV